MGMMDRQELFEANKLRLGQFAHRAIGRGMKASEFVIVCIVADDPDWSDLAQVLIPGFDPKPLRDQGQVPLARGIAGASIREYLAEVAPDVKEALFAEIPDGAAQAAVMGFGGISVYLIEPVPGAESAKE